MIALIPLKLSCMLSAENPLRLFFRGFAPFALMLFVSAQPAFAQHYPNRPIRMLVGYPPGGPVDVTARLIAPYMSEALGQQIVIDNRSGAGGTVAAQTLATAPPDGYTI